MIIFENGKPMAWLAIFAKPVPVIEFHEDDTQCVIECPYCGQRTIVGKTIMCSGYVGCAHCYFVDGGLRDTVEWYRNNNREEYANGNFYKRGFNENREFRGLKKKVAKTTNDNE